MQYQYLIPLIFRLVWIHILRLRKKRILRTSTLLQFQDKLALVLQQNQLHMDLKMIRHLMILILNGMMAWLIQLLFHQAGVILYIEILQIMELPNTQELSEVLIRVNGILQVHTKIMMGNISILNQRGVTIILEQFA